MTPVSMLTSFAGDRLTATRFSAIIYLYWENVPAYKLDFCTFLYVTHQQESQDKHCLGIYKSKTNFVKSLAIVGIAVHGYQKSHSKRCRACCIPPYIGLSDREQI